MPQTLRKISFFLLVLLSIAYIEIMPAYTSNTAWVSPISYPPPFNIPEIHSTYITSFYKWTGMLTRMDARQQPLQPWLKNKVLLAGLPSEEMIKKVNDIINKYTYVADIILWGVSDYWETPAEFFVGGGDCEDFAVAKYAWLRFMGIPEERLRIALVHDRVRNMPHAILILYTNNKAMILDNQVRDIRDSSVTSRYRIIYSLNRLGWWLPRTSQGTELGMIEDMGMQTEPASGGDNIQFSQSCLGGSDLPECINAIVPNAGQ